MWSRALCHEEGNLLIYLHGPYIQYYYSGWSLAKVGGANTDMRVRRQMHCCHDNSVGGHVVIELI